MNRTLACLLLLVVLAPTFAIGLEDKRPHQVDPRKTAIGGITAGHNESEVIGLVGNPKSVTSGYSEIAGERWKELHYEGLRIQIVEGEILGLWCARTNCATDRGVKVGDSKAKVRQVYGAGNLPYPEASEDTLRYPLTGADVYLIFVFRNEKVIEIQFFMDYT